MYKINLTEHQNPVLNTLEISNESLNFKAIIYPNLGATLQSLSFNGTETLDGITTDEEGLEIYKSKYNSSFLFPFPSRIPEGKYEFEGTAYQVFMNEPALGNALHGHIADKSFDIRKTSCDENQAEVTLKYTYQGEDPGYPFPYEFEISYRFCGKNVDLTINVFNLSSKNMPFGIGWHPYFIANDLSTTVLDTHATSQIRFNEKMQPDGEQPVKYEFPYKIGQNDLDDGFILVKPQATFTGNTYAVNIAFSSHFPNSFLQVYTPPTKTSIAVEPMTCAPNCFNNKKGLQVLKPKQTYNWQISLKFD